MGLGAAALITSSSSSMALPARVMASYRGCNCGSALPAAVSVGVTTQPYVRGMTEYRYRNLPLGDRVIGIDSAIL